MIDNTWVVGGEHETGHVSGGHFIRQPTRLPPPPRFIGCFAEQYFEGITVILSGGGLPST